MDEIKDSLIACLLHTDRTDVRGNEWMSLPGSKTAGYDCKADGRERPASSAHDVGLNPNFCLVCNHPLMFMKITAKLNVKDDYE